MCIVFVIMVWSFVVFVSRFVEGTLCVCLGGGPRGKGGESVWRATQTAACQLNSDGAVEYNSDRGRVAAYNSNGGGVTRTGAGWLHAT
jgi:hypothetical protein